jgi:hypothetical protein
MLVAELTKRQWTASLGREGELPTGATLVLRYDCEWGEGSTRIFWSCWSAFIAVTGVGRHGVGRSLESQRARSLDWRSQTGTTDRDRRPPCPTR